MTAGGAKITNISSGGEPDAAARVDPSNAAKTRGGASTLGIPPHLSDSEGIAWERPDGVPRCARCGKALCHHDDWQFSGLAPVSQSFHADSTSAEDQR